MSSTVADEALRALARLEEIKERNRRYAARRRDQARQAQEEKNGLSAVVVDLTRQLARLQKSNDEITRRLDDHHCRGCVCVRAADGGEDSSTRPDPSPSLSFSLDRLADYKSDDEPVFDNATLSPLPINRPDDPATRAGRSSESSRTRAPRRSTRRGVKRLSIS